MKRKLYRCTKSGYDLTNAPNRTRKGWPSVAVVIPCYNSEKWISRAIQSLLDQNYQNLDIIVVDDGSTDGSLEIIKSFGNKVRWETGPNFGACAARNRGIKLTQASFLLFLDADDYIEGDLLRGLVEIALRDKVDLVFGPFCFEYNNRRSLDLFMNFLDAENLISAWLCGFFVPPCAVIWRTQILKRIGSWNQSVLRNQDGELILRALCSGVRYSASTKGRGVYYQHKSPNRISSKRSLAITEAQLPILAMVLRHAEEHELPSLVQAVSIAYYNLARREYHEGNLEVADRMMQACRNLGFSGHYGSLAHRWTSTFLGLKQKELFASTFRKWILKLWCSLR
jgi:glycosyltransferase involved in cell wall biosynthesis